MINLINNLVASVVFWETLDPNIHVSANFTLPPPPPWQRLFPISEAPPLLACQPADSAQQQLEEHEKSSRHSASLLTPYIPIQTSIPGMYWSRPDPQRPNTVAHRALSICCQHIVPDTTGQRSHAHAPIG